MDRDINTWLFDIQKAIEEIEQFLPQGQRIFENYKNDLKTKRAVERNLEITGNVSELPRRTTAGFDLNRDMLAFLV